MDSNLKSSQISCLSEKWKKIPVQKKSVVWAEISSRALINNVNQVRSIIGNSVGVMAIVKADAYGHGASFVSRITDPFVNYLGVSRLSEALDLRLNSIKKPILIFGYTSVENLDIVFDCQATQAIHSYEMAKAYSDKASLSGKKLKAHIKLDTGMGRLGIFLHKSDDMNAYRNYLSSAVIDTERIASLPGLEIEGVFTHFSSVDRADASYAYRQLEAFSDYLEALDRKGIRFAYRHAAGTFSMLNIKNSLFDMVRIGKSLYGILPEVLQDRFHQALTVKSVVSFIKTVPENIRVSYAGAGIAKKSSRIATVPFGFADGYVWQETSNSFALVHGKRSRIIGRVCMDFMMIDVSDIDDVKIGDEVVITGNQNNERILLTELASKFSTTPSALAAAFTSRTPKIIID